MISIFLVNIIFIHFISVADQARSLLNVVQNADEKETLFV